MNDEKAIQDYYSEAMSQCYGCGRLNEFGLKIKSFWDGKESFASFKPKDYQIAFPGFVYGGLIASIIDCHGTGTASAAAYQAEGREMGTEPELRFATASIKVDYLKPTPINTILQLRGKVKELTNKKVVVEVSLTADNIVCAKGEIVTVKLPDNMKITS